MKRSVHILFTVLLFGTPLLIGMATGAALLDRDQPLIGAGFCLLGVAMLVALLIAGGMLTRGED